jgi:hypothetical protein
MDAKGVALGGAHPSRPCSERATRNKAINSSPGYEAPALIVTHKSSSVWVNRDWWASQAWVISKQSDGRKVVGLETIVKGLTHPTLEQVIPLIAGLGGYLGRKQDGPPGPKSMWIGLQRMRDFAIAWIAFGPAKKCV